MGSAVIHSPLDTTAAAPLPERPLEPTRSAAKPGRHAFRVVEGAPSKAAPALRPPFDWRALWLKVLPPLLGVALLVGIWGLLTLKSTTFPTPGQTFDAAVKLFADPFNRNSP